MSWLWSTDGGLSLAPALVAILLALATRRVEVSLALGVLVGGLVASGGAPLDALKRVIGYLASALGFDLTTGGFAVDHLEISLFSVLVAASVAVMGATGGTRAVIQRVERLARGRSGAMVSAWLSGIVIFFDDYANCLVVGNAMRPLCDRYGVSREKLAYIVDSTAAPVASLAVVSTWVGYEVGLIAEQLPLGGPTALEVFLASVPYRFYCLFTLVFVGAIAITGRDFGPMLAAERRAKASVSTEPIEPTTASPLLAVVPVGLLVGGTLAWLVIGGWSALTPEKLAGPGGFTGWLGTTAAVLGGANPYHAMLFGSVLGLGSALLGGLLAGRLADPFGTVREGSSHVLPALAVLFLAWSLSNAMADTGASTALTGLLAGRLPVWALPATTFVLAGATAFATGTSFGTMGILLPVAIPVALELAPGMDPILFGTTSAVLAGACLGDHASPISDTTVLSSVGAGVPLMDHVRTQAPYALCAGAISLVFHLASGLGMPVWGCLFLGTLATIALVRGLGEHP